MLLLIERFLSFGGSMLKVKSDAVKGLIARLRAAEADAKRWRHARNILTIEAIETAQSDFINFGLPPAESESIRADHAIDAPGSVDHAAVRGREKAEGTGGQ
ncbi:hypothetical protein [Pseudomonas aeruginosa]